MSGDPGQSDAVAFLSDPRSYGPGVDRVDVLETHISRVFLAGDRAYKLKRAVRFSYVDFSIAAKRREACEAELALNRRTAPKLYLEMRGIGRGRHGAVGWAEADSATDWVVVMRRFGQENLFDALARTGGLDDRLMLDLVGHIVDFHARAEPRPGFGGAAAMAAIETANRESLRRVGIFPADEIAALHARSRDMLAGVSARLDARRDAGKVRRCHGDLHLRNICLFEGRPMLFDCIEFSDRLAAIDVLYDLAFLLMDLEHHGLAGFANLAANRYFDLTGDEDGLASLPLFLSLRAAIRAHVAATTGASRADEARAYFSLAKTLAAPAAPRLVAIGGLSGTGKSTIARLLAPRLGAPPGARVLRSDVIRKRLFGVTPETRLPAGAYTPAVTRQVYDALRRKAAAALGAGYSAIVDAVALRPEDRAAFAAVAAEARVPFSGIWLDAPAETMEARIGARRDDASDASEAVLERQLRADPGSIDWIRIAVGGERNADVAAVAVALGIGPG